MSLAELRSLGREGPRVSAIGLGAWPIGGGMGAVAEHDAIATVRAAIAAGITLIDTAQAYRGSEALVGRALRDGYRSRAFVATKVSGRYGATDIATALEASLRALGVETIDLYQLHSWNPQYPIEESMAALLAAQRAGKVRWLGVSNFNVEQLTRAEACGRVHAVQNRYNLFDRGDEAAMLPFCAQAGVGYLAHSVLAKGLLGGTYTPATHFAADDERATFRRFRGAEFEAYLVAAEGLKTFARERGLTLVQLALAWALRRSEVTSVLVGARSPLQVRDYARAAEIRLSPGDDAALAALVAAAPQTPER